MDKYKNAIGIIKACGLNIKGGKELQEEAKRIESTIIDALEKQIPKKPSETDKARCIHCACVVKRDERFCKNCGQALDWSDTNDR